MEVKQSLAFVLILLNLACQAKADCDAPTGFKNAKLLSDLSDQPAVFEEKHELLYECNIGFRPATGRGSRCWNGRWTEIRCERIFCKWLPAPDNGRRLDSNAYVGEYTTFVCNEGYQLIGYKTLLCRADGKWRPSDPPVCKPVSCGRLPWLANGEAFQATRDGNLNLYGSVVKLSCKFGFDLIKGSKERRCQADGTWSGTQPVCEEPTCPKLEPFYNGVIYYQNDDVISLYHVAEIECNDGSDVFPEGTRFVTCVEGNTWDVNNITCERHLTISPPSHMKLYTGQGRYRPRITSSRRLKSRTSLHIKCEYKHELVDGKTNKYYEVNSLQVRIFNGTVVPELPLCRKERCNLVADHCSFMDTDGNKLVGKVEHNTVVVKMCDPDFEFEPSDKRKEPRQRSTCNQGVIDFPRCIPKRCVIPPGRGAKWYRRNYNDGDLFNNGQTVKRTCSGKRELFYPETQTYEENSNIFSSTCRTGVWSNGVFPICKEKRCNIVIDHCSFMDTDWNNLVGKVEHNTVVVKKCDPGFEFEPSDKRKEPNQKSTCDRGVIDFPRCIPKRCEIPHDRHARIGEDIYTADELVDSEKQVAVDCREREEVYYPESNTYAKTFTTTCRSGLWSDDKFPICKEERCSSPNERDGTRFLLDEKVVQNGDKLEHGTILTKSCNKGYEDKTNLPTKCSSGSWINDEPCTGKPCTLPAIEHTRDNETPKQLAHNGQVRVECKNGYDMIGSDVANQNIKTNCNKGNLAPSLDNIKCVPKGCSGTSKANVYRATASGVKEDEPASSFDHEEYAIVKCHDHYVLTQDSKPVSDWKSKTSRCVFGKWEPEYACEKDACHVDVPENGKLWIKTANKTKQGKTLMKNGYTGIFNCDQNYTLDNDTIVQHTDGFPITCVGNKLNTTLPTCVKSVPDSEESADMFYVNNGVQMGEATESPADEKSSITLTIPETTAAAAATKDAIISSATTDVPLASTTPFSESPNTTKDEVYYGYDYPGVDEVEPEETCPNPANGRLVRSYLSYYNVVCDDGYELYVVENDDDYKCSNGKWMSKNFGFEAECNENDCEITDEILAVMKVFNRVNGKEQYESRVRKITPNQKYYFDCKQENHEPVKRLFNCSRGNWTAIERDPNWKMQIDGMEPSCRKALCDPVCQFGGTCVKDGMCKCVPGTTGKACEIPVCNPACASNGGKCEAPNTCKCEEPRYGINCEQVGCDRPNFPVNMIMKGTKNFFEDGDVLSSDQLTCSKGYILSNTTRCIGNQTWSGKAECLKETHFELEMKVGNSQWAGSYGQLYVTILSKQGGIIHRMAFEKPDFKGLFTGQLYVISSTSGQNGKVGQLKLLLGPGNRGINDNLEIDHIRLTIQRDADNTKKEYDFSSVGWLNKNQQKLVGPDTGVFRLKYRLGDAYYAGSSDTLQISFEGNLGHTPIYLMSRGRRNKGQTYYKVIDGEYVGQIHTVTIVNQKVNMVPNYIQIDYIELTVSHEDKEEKYIFRNVGWIGSRKEIQPEITADQPEMPSCQDDFEFSAGWIDTSKLLLHSEYVNSDEECKDLCRKDERCKVAEVRGSYEQSLTCQIVYTGWESAVNYRKKAPGFRLYTRKC